MSEMGMMDAVSVQDVFVNSAAFEDLNDGNMLVERSFKSNNGNVVHISYITSAMAMIRDAQAAIDFARKILQKHSGGIH